MNSLSTKKIASVPNCERVAPQSRIFGVDVVRGLCLLGILLANIESFGTPEGMHDIPVGMAIPAFEGAHASLNLAILTLKWLFIEGKMRGLFSLLFGAGVILLTSRMEQRCGSASVADIYMRRNLWLVVFGLIHGCFIWSGDILYYYGLAALLVLYPCRHLKAKTLICTGTFVTLVLGTYLGFLLFDAPNQIRLSEQAEQVIAKQHAGASLTAADHKALDEWNTLVQSQTPTVQAAQASVARATQRGHYLERVYRNFDGYINGSDARFTVMALVDTVGVMLLGMGLCKNGFLTGTKSRTCYALTAAVGLLLSIPLYLIGMWKAYHSGFYFMTTNGWLFGPYMFTREAGMLGILSLVLLALKCDLWPGAQRAVAAVGRTALSNYILTSLLCKFIFIWGPWPLYGKLEYFELHYVVPGIWCVNLVSSWLWLKAFQHGPLEWAWRSLTYWEVLPIRRTPGAPSADGQTGWKYVPSAGSR
jgi:uncharacterized protein